MELTYFILGLCVLCLFAVRSLYRIILPGGIDGDAIFHVKVAQDIRQNGHQIPDKISQVATTGDFSYPYLMHWILSFLPKRYLMIVERFFSPVSETAFFGVILLLLPLDILTVEQAILVCLILIVTPHFMRPDMAHSIGMSARKPGLILTTITVLFFLQWIEVATPSYLMISFVSGTAIFLTSKFSVQAYLFVSIALSIAVSVYAGLLFVLTLGSAILFSGGRYLKVLKVHLYHLIDYALNKQYKKLDQSLPNPISFIRSVWNANSLMEFLEPVHKSKLRPLIDFPYVVSAVAALVLMWTTGRTIPLPTGYYTWIFAGLITATVISLPHMLFLGEPERYLEYIFLPCAVLIARSWETLGFEYRAVVIILHLVSVPIILVYIWGFKNVFFDPGRWKKFYQVLDYLEKRSPGTVLAHPCYVGKMTAWRSDHEVVETIGNQASTKEAIEELNRLFPDRYGYVTNDIEWLDEMYSPDWVIFELEKAKEHPETGLQRPDAPPIYSNELFEVYPFEVFRDKET